jgi:signal transduction histidine kinase/CheY-like chemotaxis protein/purine-cytosine permease-like protein
VTATQKIFKIRRDYNSWVADETMEDYALRYTPQAFRKWSIFRVANTAFGAVSFLALEAIGATMALIYGFWNALWAILAVGVVIFFTSLPISVYAARYGLDMDLLTRGAGFGYLGSTITSLIYASFTFIFFALEAVIMALAIELYFDIPITWAYLLSSLVVIPLVTHGVTLISRVQLWTQPVWLILLVLPFIAIALQKPELFSQFSSLAGQVEQADAFDWLMFGSAATVAFALVMQVGEQVDFLRFLPVQTRANRWRWWSAVIIAGPGWILPGMIKMLGGAFLAFVALQSQIPLERALEPTQMYLAGFGFVFDDTRWAMLATLVLVVVSQMKINMTNAYAGSLAWSNFFARLTHNHPGRVVWLVFNVLLAVLVMALGVFEALESVLGFYANIAIAWVGALVSDLVVNKPLGWSPRGIEFKRAHLYDINPVGVGATLIATVVSVSAFSGLFGQVAQAFSPFIALLTAFIASPLIAWLTKGRYYIARKPVAQTHNQVCVLCENSFEGPDMAHCPAYDGPICSLCCTLDARCHDRCKPQARLSGQIQDGLTRLLPAAVARHVNWRVGHYLVVLLPLLILLATALGLIYFSQIAVFGMQPALVDSLASAMLKTFVLLTLLLAVGAWWIVLENESRNVAQDESDRQTQLLTREIEAHRATDAKLQAAKEAAEAANLAKTRYVTGMTHELRTPLNGILGYAQILLHDQSLPRPRREAVDVIRRSGEHMLQLVDGLLDLARIEAGRLKLEPGELALREFIDQLVQMIEPEAVAKGLHFSVITEGQLPAAVNADAKRLRQILINLLANAVKFTDRGHVRLRVAYGREIARFEIEDSGVGISQEDQARIFLPFERGASGRSRGGPGTGLGLTITQLLTELMGGELSVRSQPGKGTTFTVRLYLSEVRNPVKGPRNGQEIIGYLGRRRTLLVVDDQPIQRQLLAGMLAPLGFRLLEAASGVECLALIASTPPDIVLMDVEMPEMNGWEACRTLRSLALDTQPPVIMVSANVYAKVDELKTYAGCQGFIDKPILESELLALIGSTLGLSWRYREQPAPAPAASPVPRLVRPPAAELDTLGELGRIGHVMAIRRKLDEIERRDPHFEAFVSYLREPLLNFDLDRFLHRLKEHDHAAP